LESALIRETLNIDSVGKIELISSVFIINFFCVKNKFEYKEFRLYTLTFQAVIPPFVEYLLKLIGGICVLHMTHEVRSILIELIADFGDCALVIIENG